MDDRIRQAGVHQHRLRIYYEDTDAGGIVYYANYLKFIERARTELLRHLGVESSDLMNTHGVAFAVKRCLVDYHMPAKLDDELVVATKIVRVGGASLDLQQIVQRGADRLVSVDIKLGCLNLDNGKPKAMPSDVRDRLNRCFDESHNDKNEAEG